MLVIPISAVIPTLDRRERLRRTVTSLLAQDFFPREIIIVDASNPPITAAELPEPPHGVSLHCLPAQTKGAAAQRNQGVAAVTQPWVLFADDDIDLEPGCIASLWRTIQSDSRLGACGVVITNQPYHPPGRIMRQLYTLLGCPAQGSLAGRCCGAALNFLPAADSTGDQSVDWMNLCCTLVRREALPQPPLLDFFQGYSLMEDTALTFHLGRCWRLSVPSTARVFHDVGPASYKDRPFARERMETLNRWFVMRHIMGQDHFIWDLRQLAWQCLSLTLLLRTSSGWRRFPAAFAGKVAGLTSVILHRHHWRGYIPVPAP